MPRSTRPKKKLKRDTTQAPVNPEATTVAPSTPKAVAAATPVAEHAMRDLAMFREWLQGTTQRALARKYNIHHQTVHAIAKKNKWKKLRSDLRSRLYSDKMDEIKDLTMAAQDLLFQDIDKIKASARRENRPLTKEERSHVLALYDRTLKENRLEEGKPTDIGNAPVQVQVVLPAGAKRFGILPPDPKTLVIEAEVVGKEEKTLSVEDILDGDTE